MTTYFKALAMNAYHKADAMLLARANSKGVDGNE